jgi:TolB-like protein
VKAKILLLFLFSFLCMSIMPHTSQALEEINIFIAVIEFNNNTGDSKYDYLEKAIPKTLMSELSKSKRIVIVEREKIDKILREQELGMAGITDSSRIGEIGKLLSADYIVYGDFTFIETRDIQKKIIINTHYVKIKTGAVQSEKASGYIQFLDGHIELLSNNIRNRIAGESDYLQSLKTGTPVGKYLLIGTGISFTATCVIQYFFLKSREDYRNSTTLASIDNNYDKTQKLYWTRNGLAGATLVLGLAATAAYIFDWGKRGEILAIVPSIPEYNSANTDNNLRTSGYNKQSGYGLNILYSKNF